MTEAGSLAGLTDLDVEVLKRKRVYRKAWSMELASGESVWVDRLDVQRTYLGWIEGVPGRDAVHREIASAVEFVRKSFHGPAPIVIPPLLFDPESDSPILPPLRFAAQLSSWELVGDEGCGSWMNLVWFAEIDEEKSIKAFVAEALQQVEWKKQAEGFEL